MNDYKKYKPALREEFAYACAYCQTREPELGGSQSFHIDHYMPKNQFPELVCSYENLVYACRNCNQYKGAYWPTSIHSVLGKIIFNPRPLGSIKNHIDTTITKWVGKTNSGRWSIQKLRLDSEILIKRREDRAKIESAIKRFEEINQENKQNLNKAIDDSLEKETIDKMRSAIVDLEEEILVLYAQISGAMD